MSLKKKLFTTISMFCLTIAMLMVGVWAVSSDQVSFGGTITFTATNILATISGEVSGTASDPKLDDLEYTSAGGPSDDALETWSNNLTFKEDGSAFTIEITIKNDSSRKIYWSITDTVASNANISKTISTYTLGETNELDGNGTTTFTITIGLANGTNNSVSGSYGYKIALYDESEDIPVDITEGHDYLTFSDPDITNKTISVTGVKNNTVTNVEIPAKVIINEQTYVVNCIEESAFSGCQSLTNISIPNSVTVINSDAFTNCSSLSYTTYDNAYYLGNDNNPYLLLYKAKSTTITSCIINSNCRFINDKAFYSCSKLTSIDIPNSVISLGKSAFAASGIENISLSDYITSIGESAFNGCSKLAGELKIPEGVTIINTYSFVGCSSVTNIVLPNELTSIGKGAFWGCDGIYSLTIPNSVTTISESAFRECTNLANLKIGSGLATIGYMVFYDCISLSTLDIPNTVTQIGDAAFNGCSGLTSITIPSSVTNIHSIAFSRCSSLAKIKVDDNNTKYNDGNESDCIIETLSNKLILGCKNTVIPNTVKIIGNNAFSSCTGLTSINIPNSVTDLYPNAFSGCVNLERINIPASVRAISNSVFSSCNSLETIDVDDNNPTYNDGNDGNCIISTSNNTLIVGCKNTVIPNTVTTINGSAFSGCTGLISIIIPTSVTNIKSYAFDGCTNLVTIYYKGNESQWNEISIDAYGNYYLSNASVTYNYTGA